MMMFDEHDERRIERAVTRGILAALREWFEVESVATNVIELRTPDDWRRFAAKIRERRVA